MLNNRFNRCFVGRPNQEEDNSEQQEGNVVDETDMADPQDDDNISENSSDITPNVVVPKQPSDADLESYGCSKEGYKSWQEFRQFYDFPNVEPQMGFSKVEARNPNTEWRVHSILNYKLTENRTEVYLVRWWPTSDDDGNVVPWEDTWTPKEDLLPHSQDLITKYHAYGNVRRTLKFAATTSNSLCSLPYTKSNGKVGTVVSKLFKEFENCGKFNVVTGLEHPIDKELNRFVGFELLNTFFDRISCFTNDKVFILPKAVGKIKLTPKEKIALEDSGLRVPFWYGSLASKKLSLALKNHDNAVFMVIGKKGLQWQLRDYHCVIGLIVGGQNRECYCFNPGGKPIKNEKVPEEFEEIRKRLCSSVLPLMGYGTQSNTPDCIERAIHFIGLIADGKNWMDESPNGWERFSKY